MTALCTHGVQTGAGYECAACVTTPTGGAPLALECDCTDATCPDHGLLALLCSAVATEDARTAEPEGAAS